MNYLWSDEGQVQTYFQNKGHKESFVEMVISHIQSLADLLHLWQRRVLTGNDLQLQIRNAIDAVQDPGQHQVVSTILASLRKRDECYNCTDDLPVEHPLQSDEDDEQQPDLIDMPPDTSTEDVDWKKSVLVTGKPGTVKTHCITKAIDEALDHERQILIATATGFLVTTYANAFLVWRSRTTPTDRNDNWCNPTNNIHPTTPTNIFYGTPLQSNYTTYMRRSRTGKHLKPLTILLTISQTAGNHTRE